MRDASGVAPFGHSLESDRKSASNASSEEQVSRFKKRSLMKQNDFETWMRLAIDEAHQAESIGEVPVGALVVRGSEVIARAHNLVESRQDATCHAEILAIRAATEKLSSWRLEECSLFVTLEPCPMCMGAIILSRIPKLYFGAWDPRMGAAGSQFDLSNYPQFPHQVQVFPEILKEECENLLKSFFRAVR